MREQAGTRRKLGRCALPVMALVGLLWLGGCKKPKATTVPKQAEAPTITKPEPAPAPPPTPRETIPPAPAASPASKPEVAAPPQHKAHHAAKKPAPPAAPAPAATPAESHPPGVVPEGGAAASSSQLTPSLPPEEAEQARGKATQLLISTETDLKGLTHKLSPDEQAMLDHTRSYMAQSRAALAEGDVVRAYNLAVKARLLADALLKP